MEQKKEEQVKKILLTKIVSDKNIDKIYKENNIIYSSQKYIGENDSDMSDFSVGFYEIIYKDILDNSILNCEGVLSNNMFAGDTMNSFNTIANTIKEAGKSRSQRTPIDEWPPYLVSFYEKYHCLANFWILPCDIGRSSKGNLNKIVYAKDYMDRFLKIIENYNFKTFDENYKEYFRSFNSWENFIEKHYLNKSYIHNGKILEYSFSDNSKDIILEMQQRIENRAEEISKSKYGEMLWKYFKSLNLIDD